MSVFTIVARQKLSTVDHTDGSQGLIHGQSGFPPSITLITAILLLLIGVAAIVSMLHRGGPFG